MIVKYAATALLALSLISPQILAQAGPAPVVVDAVQAAQDQSTPRSQSGYIQPRHSLRLTAAQGGQVVQIAEPGSRVAAGDLLVALDATPLQLDRQELEARLRRNAVSVQQAERRIERIQTLQGRDLVSLTELDDLREQRDLARADQAITRAQIAQLDDRIERMRISAPYTGVMSTRLVQRGEEVQAGTALGEFIGTEHWELRALLPLSWMAGLAAGDRLEVHSLNKQAQARVRALIPSADRESQTFTLLADIPAQPAQTWAAQELVTVVLPAQAQQTRLLVPRDAVVLRREGHRVVRINADNKAEWVSVRLGQGRGDWLEVEGQLTAGQRVATRGVERLQPGQEVSILRDLAAERLGQSRSAEAG